MKRDRLSFRHKLIYGSVAGTLMVLSLGAVQHAHANMGPVLRRVLQAGRQVSTITEQLTERSRILATLRRVSISTLEHAAETTRANQLFHQAEAWARHDRITLHEAEQELQAAHDQVTLLQRRLSSHGLPYGHDIAGIESYRTIGDEIQLSQDIEELARVRLVAAKETKYGIARVRKELEEALSSPERAVRETAQKELRILRDLEDLRSPFFVLNIAQNGEGMIRAAKKKVAYLQETLMTVDLRTRAAVREAYEDAQRYANLLEGEVYRWEATLRVG